MRSLLAVCAVVLAVMSVASCNCGPQPPVIETLLPEGQPCASDDECQTGLCEALPGEAAKCVRKCADGCLANERCVQLQPERYGCAIEQEGLCQVCDTDEQCPYPGDRCIALGEERVCGRDCSFDGTCPDGFRCADAVGFDGILVSTQCQPQSGTCACTPATAGQTLPCTETNANGTCTGVRTCQPAVGFSACSAPIAAPETCNGVDDDCDGQQDEGLGQTTCGVGECARVVSNCADAGTVACVPGEPSAESCDGKDNDCDEVTDEDFDLAADVQHCGACGNVCSLPNATPMCQAGACQIASCNAGFYDVDADPSNGCEYACSPTGAELCDGKDNDCNGNVDDGFDLTSDPAHCGACQNQCAPPNASPACSASVCAVGTCNSGRADCNQQYPDGCEINVLTDPQHCSGCGNVCAVPNAVPACVGGTCQVGSCQQPHLDCDQQPDNGCEINGATSVQHCGACANACAPAFGTGACNAGVCAIGTCQAGRADCNASYGDGCETDLYNDVTNCGTCGQGCALSNATAACVLGSCRVGNCSAGFRDCDSSHATGCETNIQSDPQNCGACANVCAPAFGTGACAASQCTLAACAPGRADCNGAYPDGCEVNIGTSLSHCGGCGNACAPANATGTCVAGACGIAACNPGFADCNGIVSDGCEVNLQTSLSHCGACGTVCTAANGTATCNAGSCQVASCNAGRADCNGAYADGCEVSLGTDPAHCGSCTNACALSNAAPACSGGSCQISACTPGFANCNGVHSDGCEANTQTSTGHCGACGSTCAPANAAGVCSGGTCAIAACNPGYADCNGLLSDGCEVNLQTSLGSCGTCGNSCSAAGGTAACNAGSCQVVSCNAGRADCNGAYSDGCEVNLNTDVTHCGTCATSCSLSNAAPLCNSGSCQISTCTPGFANCNGSHADGCEANTQTSTSHCGACGSVCAPANAAGSCAGGACAIAACNPGFADCNGQVADGCEVNLATSVGNCGACGNACTAPSGTATCNAGTCEVSGCNAGRADCNGSSADGCEVNLNTDVDNCGSCATPCALSNATPQCSSGTCQVSTCSPGYANCNGAHVDGCEANTQTSTAHCGACGNACNPANAAGVCLAGSCGIASCNPGFADCNGLVSDGCEVDLQASLGNCGACGNACSTANGAAACNAGSCEVASCNAGRADCNGSYSDGCEVNLNTDVTHCGSCATACALSNATPLCTGGACQISSCNPGFANCNGSHGDGCEVNTLASLANCGGCGIACAPANSLGICVAGTCGVAACASGFFDCNGLAADGCEVDGRTSVMNCGACGNACTPSNGTGACNAGSCQIATCSAGRADCNGSYSDGCEVSVGSDLNHCGGCGNVCAPANGTGQCSGGSCQIASCTGAWRDCDGAAVTGCEANTQSSLNHCGACGNACSFPNAVNVCTAGSCGFTACQPNFWDLDGNQANGCEYACTFVSASDEPDELFLDANCDGIDGELAAAIFVDTQTGLDLNPGTRAAPKKTVGAGISRAAADGRSQVLISSGIYTERVTLVEGISLYGGYSAGNGWVRGVAHVAEIVHGAVVGGRVTAMEGSNLTARTVVDRLTLRTLGTNAVGVSNYAFKCTGCDGVVLRNSVLEAGSAGPGAAGSAGATGGRGWSGGSGGQGSCDGSTPGGGGSAGTSSCSRTGGAGGRGGTEGSNAGVNGSNGTGGTPGGGGGAGGDPGRRGGNGTNGSWGFAGSNGGGGSGGSHATGEWVSSSGGNGGTGGVGNGGGGGGGGGGQGGWLVDDGPGNGGGGGGGGGCGGGGGTGGRGGGGSFGLFLVNSPAFTLENNRISSGAGGNGGEGGVRGAGGAGGAGGLGGTTCTSQVGAGGNGGTGGAGGPGGFGGGGAGGPSYAVYRVNSPIPTVGNILTAGAGGAGGSSTGNGGANGASGTVY